MQPHRDRVRARLGLPRARSMLGAGPGVPAQCHLVSGTFDLVSDGASCCARAAVLYRRQRVRCVGVYSGFCSNDSTSTSASQAALLQKHCRGRRP